MWSYYQDKLTALGDTNKGGRLRFFTQYVKNIPIPKAEEKEKKAIEKLVQKCLDAKGVNCEEWEAEIDDRVTHLYELTDEEMKIIRGITSYGK